MFSKGLNRIEMIGWVIHPPAMHQDKGKKPYCRVVIAPLYNKGFFHWNIYGGRGVAVAQNVMQGELIFITGVPYIVDQGPGITTHGLLCYAEKVVFLTGKGALVRLVKSVFERIKAGEDEESILKNLAGEYDPMETHESDIRDEEGNASIYEPEEEKPKKRGRKKKNE